MKGKGDDRKSKGEEREVTSKAETKENKECRLEGETGEGDKGSDKKQGGNIDGKEEKKVPKGR